MFKRLVKSPCVESYSLKDTQFKCGTTDDAGNFLGLHYRFADISNADKLLEIIPEEYRKSFCLSVMEINTTVPPHTDSGIKVVINFYYDTDGGFTRFYRLKTDKPTLHQIENQHDGGFIFDLDDLEFAGEFSAKPGDAWILDVTYPHSVTPRTDKKRVAVQMATADFTYDQVLLMLKHTRSI
jgi:hypothetical protein